MSNRPQILKYREIFNLTHNRNEDRELIYNNINNVSDNKEVIVLVEGIKLKLGIKDNNEVDEKFISEFTEGKSIISAYGSVNNRYQRMLELKYRTERCYFIMKYVLKLSEIFDKEFQFIKNTKYTTDKKDQTIDKIADSILENIKTIIGNKFVEKNLISIREVVEFLIQEALFCSKELIKMIKLYNPGYVIGYSFIAESHSRMGDWCQAYENYLKLIDNYQYEYAEHLHKLEGLPENVDKSKIACWAKVKDNFEKLLLMRIKGRNLIPKINILQRQF